MATLTSLSPSPSRAGQTLTLTGTSLGTTTRVNFGNRAVTPTSVSATTATCVIPSVCAGQYNINLSAGTTTSNALPFFSSTRPRQSWPPCP